MKRFKRWGYYCLAILLLHCAPQKRFERLLNKHPNLLKTDTLLVKDSIVRLKVQKDTIFHFMLRDTIVVQEEQLTLKYYYNLHDSTIYLQGECASDTLIVEQRTIHNSIYKNPPWLATTLTFGKKAFWLLLLIAIVILLFKGLRRR